MQPNTATTRAISTHSSATLDGVTTFTIADDLALALAAAANADLVSLDRFKALDLVVSTKPDNTPVTDADQAVERIIRKTNECIQRNWRLASPLVFIEYTTLLF